MYIWVKYFYLYLIKQEESFTKQIFLLLINKDETDD